MTLKDQKQRARAMRMVARDDLHQVGAVVKANGLLSPDLAKEVLSAHRKGRDSRASVEALNLARNESFRLAEKLRDVLRNAAKEAPVRIELPVKETPAKKGRSRPSEAVIPLEQLPLASEQGDLFGPTSTARSEPALKPKSVIEVLSGEPARLSEYALRLEVVRLMNEEGLSAREALDRLGAIDVRERNAQRWAENARAGKPVTDGRWGRRGEPRVLTKPVRWIVLSVWNARPSATAKEITDEVKKQLESRRKLADLAGAPFPHVAPTHATVKRFIRRLPPPLKRQRGHGNQDLLRQRDHLLGHTTVVTVANELWETDFQELKVRVRVMSGGKWRESKVYLLAILDCYSRSIMGWRLTTVRPDSWTACTALYFAISKKPDARLPMHGKPLGVKPDRGGEFENDEFRRLLRVNGIEYLPAPPDSPNAKAHIESWFSALQKRLTVLPGYHDDESGFDERKELFLMRKQTFSQFAEWLTDDIVAYHHRVHSTINRTPEELWLESTEEDGIRCAEEENLSLLLLHATETRVVSHGEVRFVIKGIGGRYAHEKLVDYNGKAILIRYNPEDRDSILIYSIETNEFICEAPHADLMTVHELRSAKKKLRRSLQERTRDYLSEEWERDFQRQADYDDNFRPVTSADDQKVDEKARTKTFSRRGRRGAKPEQSPVDAAVQALRDKFSAEQRFGT